MLLFSTFSAMDRQDLRLHLLVRFAIMGILLITIFSGISPAYAQLRIADSVAENFVPQRNVSNNCSVNVADVSDGNIAPTGGYCPFGGQPTYRITLNFSNPSANQSFDSMVLWVNSGTIYTDLELSIFDLEVDYLDNGVAATLRMRNVTLPDTLNANDPQTVLFRLNDGAGAAVVLRGVSQIRIRNLRNNLQSNGEIPIREIQLRQILTVQAVNLEIIKTSAIFDPNNQRLFSIPGNDVTYRVRVTNTGGSPDTDSVNIVDIFPLDLEFFNGDADGNGPGTGAINFTDSNSGLTFNLGSDARYSNAATRPASFANCNYTPVAGYDPAVRFICLRPRGQFRSATPAPFIEFTFRARIK